MIRKLIQSYLRQSGKKYEIDPRIPESLLLRTFYIRFFMMMRGILFLRKKVFLGKRVTILNKSNITFGRNVTINSYSEIDGYASEKVVFGDNVKIGSYSKLLSTSHFATYGKGIVIGYNSAFGDFTHFGAPGGISIGNDVIGGSYISFHSENHNFSEKGVLIREQGVNSKGIKIGNNIWIGAKVTFLDGCVVGDNCVIAAGAVVRGDFPENCIIGGVPAKIIKTI
jgi:acetyltransferase-like isoleucine patch superfamily enzyme